MIYVPYMLQGILADALDAMFYLKGYSPEHGIERLVPDGKIAIVLALDGQQRFIYDNETLTPLQTCENAWVSGMQTGFISISALKNTELLAIQFKVGKAFPFIKQPLGTLQDRVVQAQEMPNNEILGEEILALKDTVSTTLTPEDKLDTVAQWLTNRYNNQLLPKEPISNAIQQIIANPVVPTIKEVMKHNVYSKKHFIHLFKKHAGLSPKALQRVLRFAQVLPLIQEEKQIQWAQISTECGYFDQSHFIKDFLHFSGYNPSAFLKEDHDRPNFFPVDSDR